MHQTKPDSEPICCYQKAVWVVQSPSIAYFYCTFCKKEVETIHNSKKRTMYRESFDTNKVSRRVR